MASIAARKKKLVDWIESLEDKGTLSMLEKVRDECSPIEPVAVNSQGEPLTPTEYTQLINDRITLAKEPDGNLSMEDFKKEAERRWKSSR